MKTWWVPFAVVGVLVGAWWVSGPHASPPPAGHLIAIQRDALLNLASIAFEEGKLDEAESSLLMAQGYDPNNLDVKSGLATVQMARACTEKDPEIKKAIMGKVIRDYLDVAESRLNNPQDWQRLSAAFNNVGMLEEARVAMEQALKMGGS